MKHLSILTAIVTALLTSGCKTFEEGFEQQVTIHSFPPYAVVFVDGEDVGTTPIRLELPRLKNHEISFAMEGYKTLTASLAPEDNEKGNGLVRFGLMEDTGLYHDLTPSPLEVHLMPAELPDRRKVDAYDEMASIILAVDQDRENGVIGPVEHKYKIDRILEFYSN